MKKLALIIGAALLVVAGAGIVTAAILMRSPQQAQQDQVVDTTVQADKKAPKACDILTLTEAKTVLGAAAVTGDNPDTNSNIAEDLKVSSCTYVNGAKDVKAIRTSSVLVRSALSSAGIEANKQAFQRPPEGSQTVNDLGDSAFWSPQLGQLFVLKSNSWVTITSGGVTPASRTQDEALKVARLLVRDL